MAFDIVHRKNGTFQVRIRLPQLKFLTGKETYHETFDTLNEAKRKGEYLHAQFLTGLAPQSCVLDSVSVVAILDNYLEERVPEMRGAASEASRVRALKVRFNDLRLSDVTIKFLEGYKKKRLGTDALFAKRTRGGATPTHYLANLTSGEYGKKEEKSFRPVKPQTVRHELSALRRALKHYGYTEQIDISRHAIMHVKLPSKSPELFRSLTDDQILNITKRTDSTLLAMALEFMVETAMRRGELVSLRWEDCHLDRGYVVLHDTKSPKEEKRESRTVPLTPRALAMLRSMCPPIRNGQVWPITADALTKAFGRARERAGINGVRLHDARHESTTRFFDQGLNTMQVASITGHKDLRTLKRYTHISAERLAKKLQSNCMLETNAPSPSSKGGS